tara:strand:- start:514 stop:1407 length:894 start_codon:yes stop_codon:yes gene_type:complete
MEDTILVPRGESCGGPALKLFNDNFIKSMKFKNLPKKYELIGKGSYSRIIISEEIGNDKVIKCIRKSSVQSNNRKYLINEIKIMKQINNDLIVKMFDLFQSEDSFNILLERGRLDLFVFSKNKPYSKKICNYIVRDLSISIEYIHSMSIYHRDIKSENIIIFNENEENYQFKLSDFGISVVDNDYGIGNCGSIGFNSPEMSNKIQFSRKKADYWAFGAVLLEQLIGQDRFVNEWLMLYYDRKHTKLSNLYDNALKIFKKEGFDFDWSILDNLLNIDPIQRHLPNNTKIINNFTNFLI